MPKMSLSIAHLFFAQAAAPVSPAGGPAIMSFLPIIFLAGAMYFLMIAPQRKKQKAHEKMVAALKSGDEVVTTGGMYGTITNVKDDRFVLRIAENTKIEVAKGFIQSVVKTAEGEEKK